MSRIAFAFILLFATPAIAGAMTNGPPPEQIASEVQTPEGVGAVQAAGLFDRCGMFRCY